jgi:hypothetical protein
MIEHVLFKDYNNNILKINNHVHLNHIKKILYLLTGNVIFVDIETFDCAFNQY